MLVDSGCSRSTAAPWVARACGSGGSILAVDGSEVRAKGEAKVTVEVRGYTVTLNCLIADRLVGGLDVILGQDFGREVGGVATMGKEAKFGVWKQLASEIGAPAVSVLPGPLSVVDSDFSAEFDGSVWTVCWNRKEGQPQELKNTVGCYDSTRLDETREKFAEEV